MRQRILVFLFLLLIIFPIGRVVWQKWDYYFSPFDLERAQGLYNISQYVREEGASWIADEIHFAYASWYLINGGSPILVNSDYPPLGKYIVGLSIKFFNNEKFPSLIFGFLSLFSFFLLCRLFLKKTWLALLPVAILSWERLFQEQLMFLPLFELFCLTFLNFSIYFFIKAEKKSVYFILSSVFLGGLMATRPWMMSAPLLLTYAVYLLIIKKGIKKFLFWSFSLPMAVTVILISYLKLFWEGWSFYKVLSVQKWIMWYHSSKLVGFGSVWPLIYLNRWYVWWGDQPYLSMVQWNLFWPIFTTLALIFSVLVFLKIAGLTKSWLKNFEFDPKIVVLCLWAVFYLAFLSIGNISSRYLFYLLPYCYLLGIYFLKGLSNRKVSALKKG